MFAVPRARVASCASFDSVFRLPTMTDTPTPATVLWSCGLRSSPDSCSARHSHSSLSADFTDGRSSVRNGSRSASGTGMRRLVCRSPSSLLPPRSVTAGRQPRLSPFCSGNALEAGQECWTACLVTSLLIGANGGGRTHMAVNRWNLNPVRLPIPPRSHTC